MKLYKADGTYVEVATGDGAGDESVAKERLTGKVIVALGDSYTAQMSSQFSTLATKFGMVIDNRGVAKSSLSDRGTAAQTMYDRADVIVSDYTNGKTISGQTYYADDVAIITIMGGANDGAGIDRWIGRGIHETDPNTIYGSMNHILKIFSETFTAAKIIVIAQPSPYNATKANIDTDAEAQELGFDNLADLQVMTDIQFSNYCTGLKEAAVRDAAWRYSCEYIDMFAGFPTILNPDNRSTYYEDTIHPNDTGYNIIANAIERKIVEVFGQ